MQSLTEARIALCESVIALRIRTHGMMAINGAMAMNAGPHGYSLASKLISDIQKTVTSMTDQHDRAAATVAQ